ncbi:hypothetical protein TNIN_440041 [Trichonephila inaurata madagascariensis]|uniref:Uncharacterized protein n=1 Tax=Trichonephila inaurata madagascariensis TaxID=2747483 RepID=A0A8X6X208_9ARAC|nr:hypothetical protein TNIN_440041 [Trichonephila inaurata madagascariensis]
MLGLPGLMRGVQGVSSFDLKFYLTNLTEILLIFNLPDKTHVGMSHKTFPHVLLLFLLFRLKISQTGDAFWNDASQLFTPWIRKPCLCINWQTSASMAMF